MRLSVRDGRAVLAGPDTNCPSSPADGSSTVLQEVDPRSLPLGAELAEALHEWARVAAAIGRTDASNGAAGDLVFRRGLQLAGRVAAVMGTPVCYVDPLSGQVQEVAAPGASGPADHTANGSAAAAADASGDHASGDGAAGDAGSADSSAEPVEPVPAEPTPWAAGITVSACTAIVIMMIVVGLSVGLGATNRWLSLVANVVIVVGLAPSVWLTRRVPVWRWVSYGIVAGIIIGWIGLLFTAL